ncbi:BCCT family transporter [Salinisphaera sp. USBA-960]|uniref:BCCT family transporter n=1 Tax=Salinisphaera orenii TaxID=856731 RepID=UPI000DBE703D|nr:BCCT family transporter [Salifodinibacter halophilus]NNC25593.1 BCCT family transporter [Salifodinibacter halophilus]
MTYVSEKESECADSPPAATGFEGVNWKAFVLSGVPLLIFVVVSLIDESAMSAAVSTAFSWSAAVFGAYWQILLLATFFIGLGVAASPVSRARIGNTLDTDMSTFRWVSVIMCTLLAGGGVFWSAAEPIAHVVNPPPLFGDTSGFSTAVHALAYSFMHWGFLAWAILASLTGIVLSHLHYDRGLPLLPRTLLYPVFGDAVMRGWFGAVIDAVCVLAVAAGTIGPVGFLGLQVGYGLQTLFGIPNVFFTQILVVAGITAVYVLSAMLGIRRGIENLSRFNVLLGLSLMAFIVVFGPTAFIFNAYVQGLGTYIQQFLPMATYRGDPSWLGNWTIFFWGWFLGYGPLMAIFVAKISRGRTVRQMVLAVSVLAPMVTTFWFTVLGGTGVAYELAAPGSISNAFEGFNLPAALMAITQTLPLGFLISILFLVLTTVFVATTGDSMSYTISIVMTANEEPPIAVRIFWGIAMGTMAAILITLGSGGVSALQSFIVVTAVPVSLVLLPSLWNGPQMAWRMAREQGLVADAAEPVKNRG